MFAHKILVVDDEAFIADMSRMTLGDIGHDVFCAYSGEQAVEMAMESHFDLAIVDAMLPGMSGMETFDIIRQTNPGVIGILVTGHANIDMVVEAMNKGFSRVLGKPLDTGELVKAVQEALALAHLREENTRLKTLLPLYKLGEKFLSAASCQEIYEELLDTVCLQISVPFISLMMFVEQENCLKVVASRGMDQELASSVILQSGEKIAGWVYAHGKPVILNKQTQALSPFKEYLHRDDVTASISFPLCGRGKVLGVINISQTTKDVEYSQSDIEMLSVICGQAVMAIQNVASMEEREQNARTKALFEQYVAPEVAEILLNSSKNPMEIGGVKEITILFADIRNFTLAVQHLSHQELRLFLNEFFDLFSEVVFSWKGTLDKFMGDAALVAYGAPVTLKDPSQAAVCTAIELSHGFEQLRHKWFRKSDIFAQLGLGIGISRGEVFHGNVGSSRRLDYTVIGTDVNIAQRLASETESGQILITESVYKDVLGSFPMQEEKARQLRGLEKVIKLYSIRSDQVEDAWKK
ncbi:MAG: response regulator [Proteobacteria bacterium]|nr:response regulator [Pseudomonadota bacterium]MBU1056909.1 response regulator [Pseudomonadota bacterium]